MLNKKVLQYWFLMKLDLQRYYIYINYNDIMIYLYIILQASPSNPLKILHSILENPKSVPMVALSNWKLDESKMNRVVIANRPKLSLDELKEAAIAL